MYLRSVSADLETKKNSAVTDRRYSSDSRS
jgi:hypothetical protein